MLLRKIINGQFNRMLADKDQEAMAKKLRSSKKAKPNQVYLSRFVFHLGLILAGLASVIPLLFYMFDPDVANLNTSIKWLLMLCFSPFILIGLMLIIIYKYKRIIYDDRGFRYSTMFNRTYEIRYDEIKDIKKVRNTIYLYTDKKRLQIDMIAIGSEKFMKKIEKVYFAEGESEEAT